MGRNPMQKSTNNSHSHYNICICNQSAKSIVFLTLAAGRQAAHWNSETEAPPPPEKRGSGHREIRKANEYEGVGWGAGEEAGAGAEAGGQRRRGNSSVERKNKWGGRE